MRSLKYISIVAVPVLAAISCFAVWQQYSFAPLCKYILADADSESVKLAYPNYTTVAYLAIIIARLLACIMILSWFALVSGYLKKNAKRWLVDHKRLWLRVAAVSIVLFVLVMIIGACEWALYKAGYFPGSYYRGFHPVDTLYNDQLIWSDTLGLNRNSFSDTARTVNADGFLATFDFQQGIIDSLKQRGKKIVMILGDSFTWGVAETKEQTYIEQLKRLDTNYVILNFGVPGVDPLNYHLIAKQYVPLLKPDVVVVAFCGSNDFMLYDRLPAPGIPLFYNGSFDFEGNLAQSQVPAYLGGKPNEVFPSIDSLYNFYLRRFYIPAMPQASAFDKCFSHTRVTSFIWWAFHAYPYFNFKGSGFEQPHLQQTKNVCKENNAGFIIAFIPNGDELYSTLSQYHSRYDTSFNRLSGDVYFPVSINESDYGVNGDNVHWNNSGNRKFAVFVNQLLQHELKQ